MSSYLRQLLLGLATAGGLCAVARGQEILKIPPMPTEREHKTPEQLRRDWEKICAKARADAVAILKQWQRKDGSWVPNRNSWDCEIDALAIEALLDSGVPPDDPVIIKGLRSLRLYRPQTTTAVALQTVALCKANDRRDWELIQGNVDWLLKAARRDGRRLRGWALDTDAHRPSADRYTFDAVAALRAARLVGIRFDAAIWKEVRGHYLERQLGDGGWRWISETGPKSSPEPTAMALYSLYVADEMLGETKRSALVIRSGIGRLAESPWQDNRQALDFHYVMARLGGMHVERDFRGPAGKKREWFEDGTIWLINHQTPSGTFFVPRFDMAKTTAIGLLFLAAGK